MNKKSAAKVPREQRKELFVLLRIEFDLVIISIISTRWLLLPENYYYYHSV